MKAKNWIYGLGFLVLLGGGVPLPVSAAENAQIVTRGGHKHYHKPDKKRKEDRRFRKIPPHYEKVYHGKKCYYYHDGFYYRPCDGGYYERFRPFIGMIIPVLPRHRVHVVHKRGQEFLVCEGVLYKRVHTRYGIRYKVVGFA